MAVRLRGREVTAEEGEHVAEAGARLGETSDMLTPIWLHEQGHPPCPLWACHFTFKLQGWG